MSELDFIQQTRRQLFYEKLKDAYHKDKLILFCGAGCSMNSGFPSFSRLTEKIAKETIEDGAGSIPTDVQNIILAYAQKDVIKAIQAITNAVDNLQYPPQQNFGKRFLTDRICHHFQLAYNNITDLSLQRNLLKIGTYEGRIKILTTNWDVLLALDTEIVDIELQTNSLPSKTSYYSTIPSIPFPETEGGIYHLHGIIDRFGKKQADLLITSEEYITAYDAGTERRTLLENLIKSDYTVLFIGYSLDDPFIWERFIKGSFEDVLKRNNEDPTKEKDNKESNFFALFPNDEQHRKKANEFGTLKLFINVFHYGLPYGFEGMTNKWDALGNNFRQEIKELADYITSE